MINNVSNYFRQITMERNQEIYQVTLVGGVVNVVLLLFKFVAGIVGHSAAMVADAVHSLSDFVTDVIVLVFVHISSKPKDKSHDYGHGKYETLAMTLIGVALLIVAIGIIYHGAMKIVAWLNGEQLEAPGTLALWAALLSVLLKEGVYQYSMVKARQLNSQVVEANAWHHRSDALSSVGTAIGIEEEILRIVGELKGVVDPHDLRTRKIGNHYAIELHILMDGDITLREAHNKASEVEDLLRARYGEHTHVAVHVEPKENM